MRTMTVKLRNVGNSLTLTVPVHAAEELGLVRGQSLELEITNRALTYWIPRRISREITWAKYETTEDVRDGMQPEEYVRRLRDDERKEVVF